MDNPKLESFLKAVGELKAALQTDRCGTIFIAYADTTDKKINISAIGDNEDEIYRVLGEMLKDRGTLSDKNP